jgi:histidinol-phosphate aminotransferase
LRLGCAIGPKAWLDEFEKLRLPYNVNVLSAAAGELLLGHPACSRSRRGASCPTGRRWKRRSTRSPGVQRFPRRRTSCWCAWRTVRGRSRGLKQRGILVRTFHGSHPLLANTLRLTVGTPEENRRLVEALRSILA